MQWCSEFGDGAVTASFSQGSFLRYAPTLRYATAVPEMRYGAVLQMPWNLV